MHLHKYIYVRVYNMYVCFLASYEFAVLQLQPPRVPHTPKQRPAPEQSPSSAAAEPEPTRLWKPPIKRKAAQEAELQIHEQTKPRQYTSRKHAYQDDGDLEVCFFGPFCNRAEWFANRLGKSASEELSRWGEGVLYHCPHIDWTPGRLKCLPTEASPELRVIAAERRSVPFRTQRPHPRSQPPSRLFCLQSPFWPVGGPALRSISSPQPEGALPPHLPASPDARPRQSARLDFSPLDDLELSPASSPDGKGPMLEDEKQLGRGRGG